jgi:pimeloyl-ACP methyl ester carboxylesterase
MPIFFPSFVRDSGNRISRWLHRQGIRAPNTVELWRAYQSLVDTENRQAFVRTLRAVVDPGGQSVSARDRLYLATAMPTLLIWGDRDNIIPIEHAHQAHAAMPGSRLEIFQGVGHFPHVEAPQRFVEVLGDFIASTEPACADLETYRELLRAEASPGESERPGRVARRS